ncbi:MAG: tandem-95 repeat protein, partial [Pseudomonadota bacterium]
PDQAINEDTAWSFTVPANTFSDIDVDTLSYSASLSNDNALPSWVSFSAASRKFSGTPPANYNGQIDLKVTASDDAAAVSDVFRLTVKPVNDRPVARDDTGFTTTVIKNLTIAKSTLLANDTDVDSSSRTLTAVKNGTGGTVSISGGNVIFKPSLTFKGNAHFTYTVSDGKLTDTGKVTINVTVPAVTPGSKTFTGGGTFKIPFYTEITIEVAGGGGGNGQSVSYRCGRDDCRWSRASFDGRSGGASRFNSLVGNGGGGGKRASSQGAGATGSNGSATGGNSSNVTGGGAAGSRGGGSSNTRRGGGSGGNGGRATSVWNRGSSGAPTIGSTVSFSVGGGGAGFSKGGSGGWVKFSWK